ncbi:MAG: hypothetical protein WAX80_03100 [Minisyncoccia bacterium]
MLVSKYMEHETFFTLLTDAAHWQFEIFLIFLFDVLIGLLIWPWIKKFLIHHKSDDERIAELERRIDELSK